MIEGMSDIELGIHIVLMFVAVGAVLWARSLR